MEMVIKCYHILTALSEVLDEVSLALELVRELMCLDELVVCALHAMCWLVRIDHLILQVKVIL